MRRSPAFAALLVLLGSELPAQEPSWFVRWADRQRGRFAPSLVPLPRRRVIVCRFGVRATHPDVERALKWLADHQDEDGRWDADGFTKHDDGRAKGRAGYGNPMHDVAVTSLAVLAFTAHGATLRGEPHRKTLYGAVRWLRKQQSPNGRFGAGASQAAMYDHVLATWALCEVAGMSRYLSVRWVAQRGLDFLAQHRLRDGGYGYTPADARSNSVLTALCVLALKSAREFRFRLDAGALQAAVGRVESLQDADGRHVYHERAGAAFRHSPGHARTFPPRHGEALTAVGLCARLRTCEEDRASEPMLASAELLVRRPPRPQPRGAVDHFYWLFGTLAVYMAGPRQFDAWRKHLKRTVLDTQRRTGSFAGSWDPVGVWGGDGGRVYSTAAMAIVLTIYHRYCRLVR